MFIIEGNIGTGKTTMLEAIQKHLPELAVQFESVSSWQQKQNGESILELFYADTPRWAYTMEISSLTTRIPEYFALQQDTCRTQIVERSIYSGLHCFAYNCYKSNFLQPVEWEIFKQWFDFAIQKCRAPQGFIYLQADPEISFSRIKKRDRFEESTISLEYVTQIHERHEEFLIQKKNVHPSINDTPVLVLNCNQDIALDNSVLQDHLTKISAFINTAQADFMPKYKYDAYQP
jgi:deoxyguanosine kinase